MTLWLVLPLIGVPFLEGSLGNEAQTRAIAIGDLQMKIAELQRGRAESAQKIREKVLDMVLEFDTTAREFQISQEITRREMARLKILKIKYQFGEGSSEDYLAQLSAIDRKKAETFKHWTKMRSQLALLKILVVSDDF